MIAMMVSLVKGLRNDFRRRQASIPREEE